MLPIPYVLSILALSVAKVYYPLPSLSLTPILSLPFPVVIILTLRTYIALLFKEGMNIYGEVHQDGDLNQVLIIKKIIIL